MRVLLPPVCKQGATRTHTEIVSQGNCEAEGKTAGDLQAILSAVLLGIPAVKLLGTVFR